MRRIANYHRPSTVADALALLDRPGLVTIPLGGGTAVNGGHGQADEVVDLQALGLDQITTDGVAVTLGAMARLQDVYDEPSVPATLRELARAEAPSTLRSAATVGGTVAAVDPESVFLAGLVAAQATVEIVTSHSHGEHPITAVLADRSLLEGGIITRVLVPDPGNGRWARTGRTPSDTPIVAVVGFRSGDGSIRLAATGVASTPIHIEPGQADGLDPPSDFRGSSGYRRHLVSVLSERVVSELDGGAA